MRCRFSDPSLPVGVAAVAKMATRRGERDAITLSKFLWKLKCCEVMAKMARIPSHRQICVYSTLREHKDLAVQNPNYAAASFGQNERNISQIEMLGWIS